jgi:hypothetical protein
MELPDTEMQKGGDLTVVAGLVPVIHRRQRDSRRRSFPCARATRQTGKNGVRADGRDKPGRDIKMMRRHP